MSKCVFAKIQVNFLGYLINKYGIKPLPEKVRVIEECQRPTQVNQLKRFLAMVNFYLKFLPHAAENQRILQSFIIGNKMNHGSLINWTSEGIEAFNQTKQILLTQHSCLIYRQCKTSAFR